MQHSNDKSLSGVNQPNVSSSSSSRPSPLTSFTHAIADVLSNLTKAERERVYDDIHGVRSNGSSVEGSQGGKGGLEARKTRGTHHGKPDTRNDEDLPQIAKHSPSSLSTHQRHQQQHQDRQHDSDGEEQILLNEFQEEVDRLIQRNGCDSGFSVNAYRIAMLHNSHYVQNKDFVSLFIKARQWERDHSTNASIDMTQHPESDVGQQTAATTTASSTIQENIELCRKMVVKGAVKQMMNFYEMKLSLFGPAKLTKDITIDDFMHNVDVRSASGNGNGNDYDTLKSGFLQIVPLPDRSGRKIALLCKSADRDHFTVPSIVSIDIVIAG